jgi:inorganic pyrophosphatase
MLHYKDLHGKKVELNGWDNRDTAVEILNRCHADYQKKFNK